jgi:hypothetical protein
MHCPRSLTRTRPSNRILRHKRQRERCSSCCRSRAARVQIQSRVIGDHACDPASDTETVCNGSTARRACGRRERGGVTWEDHFPRTFAATVIRVHADLFDDGQMCRQIPPKVEGWGVGLMRRFMCALGALWLLVIGGCANLAVNGADKISPATLAKRNKAVLVMSSSAMGQFYFSMKPYAMSTQWQISTREIHPGKLFSTSAWQDDANPSVQEVDPGTYDMIAFAYQIGNVKTSSNGGAQPGVFLARVTVAAGEVIYAGHLTLTRDAAPPGLFKIAPSTFKLSVSDNEAKVRANLKSWKPDLAPMMTTRLMSIPAPLQGPPPGPS